MAGLQRTHWSFCAGLAVLLCLTFLLGHSGQLSSSRRQRDGGIFHRNILARELKDQLQNGLLCSQGISHCSLAKHWSGSTKISKIVAHHLLASSKAIHTDRQSSKPAQIEFCQQCLSICSSTFEHPALATVLVSGFIRHMTQIHMSNFAACFSMLTWRPLCMLSFCPCASHLQASHETSRVFIFSYSLTFDDLRKGERDIHKCFVMHIRHLVFWNTLSPS